MVNNPHDESLPSEPNAHGLFAAVSYQPHERATALAGTAGIPPVRTEAQWGGVAVAIPDGGLPHLPDDLIPDGGWLGDREGDAWDEEGDGDAAAWGAAGDESFQRGRRGGEQQDGSFPRSRVGGSSATAVGGGSNVGGGSFDRPGPSTFGSDRGESEPQRALVGSAASGEGRRGSSDLSSVPLCSRHAASGSCPRGDLCQLVHGSLCETCGRYALHPYSPEESERHRLECTRRHERLAARLRSSQVCMRFEMWRMMQRSTVVGPNGSSVGI